MPDYFINRSLIRLFDHDVAAVSEQKQKKYRFLKVNKQFAITIKIYKPNTIFFILQIFYLYIIETIQRLVNINVTSLLLKFFQVKAIFHFRRIMVKRKH